VSIQSTAADTTTVRGLVAGDGDVAWVGALSALKAVAAGSHLKILSSFAPRLDYLLIAQKTVPDLKSLAGGTVAVSQIGSVSEAVPRMMIEQARGDTSKTKWLSVGGSAARMQMLVAKRVDATILNSPFGLRALGYDTLHSIGDAVQVLPHFQYSWEIVSETAVAKKRAAIQAFVTATARATRWSHANPDKAALISEKLLPDVPAQEIAAVAAQYAKTGYFSSTGEVQRADWDFTIAAMVKNGDLAAPLRYDDVVLGDFVTGEKAALGPAKP
jgi:ABC-type nitrate/sulfonate/bicarbonate transport system substrate-binding protein